MYAVVFSQELVSLNPVREKSRPDLRHDLKAGFVKLTLPSSGFSEIVNRAVSSYKGPEGPGVLVPLARTAAFSDEDITGVNVSSIPRVAR